MKSVNTYSRISDFKIDPEIKYIWFASWYPSNTDPYNGDFIKRHAKSVSLYEKILVFHIIHLKQKNDFYEIEVNIDENLTEIILYVGISENLNNVYSKILYNIRFHFIGWKMIMRILKQIYQVKFIHVHVPIKMGRLALALKYRYGIPYLVSEHSGKYLTNEIDSFENRGYIYKHFLKLILKNAKAIVQVSNAHKNKFQSLFKIDNQFIIRNVVDERYFHLPIHKHNHFRFIHVSNFSSEKNINGIINALDLVFKKRQDFILTIVGNKEKIERPYLEMKGILEYEQVAIEMKNSDCFILFSNNENFPCVIIEALCCGLPVITSNVGGSAESINDENGLIIEKENIDSLSNAIEFMIDQKDTFDHEKIALDAQSKYNRYKIGSEFIKLYQDLSSH